MTTREVVAQDYEPSEEMEEQYQEWLMAQPELMICNGDDLIRHFERQTGWDDFIRGKSYGE